MTTQEREERREEEAARWTARLDGGGMTERDHAALAAWLQAHPEHQDILARYRSLSAGIEARMTAVAAARRNRTRWTTALGAAAALAIFFTVLALRPEAIETKLAERHTAALTDGSRVELNARTEVAIDFRRSERRVRLEHGEVLFQVAKDPQRPFVVTTPVGSVRVTGTVFNVRVLRGGRAEITVLEGRVEVEAVGTPGTAALPAGGQAVAGDGRVTVRELPPEAAQDAVAWRHGQVVFNDTPLADAIERFAAYHPRVIRVDADAGDLRLGGRYALDDLNGLLEAVERVLPVRVLQGEGNTVRIARVK